jgi:hypothetical protein
MIIYYSGSTSGESLPERALLERPHPQPAIMLTFFEIDAGRGDTLRRFERHAKRRKNAKVKKNDKD